MRAIQGFALAAALSVVPQTQAPPRTGLIVGQVLDGQTNRPIPEAIVTLMASGPGVDSRERTRVVMADTEGRYFFSELPPGSYSIGAVKAGYPQNFVGVSRAAVGTTGRVDLAVGERRSDSRIYLWKHATIAGTVLDELGEPMVGIEVLALRRTVTAGQVNLVAVSGGTATTDDRGAFRIAELRPGWSYVFTVPSSQTTLPIAMFQSGVWQKNEELRTAISEFQILGYRSNQQIGDLVLMTESGFSWPPAPTESGQLAVYPVTFYPATTSASDATVVSLEPGEERLLGTIQVRPVPAVRVSGKLVGPNGPMGLTAMRLSAVGDALPQMLDPVTGLTNPEGDFTLLGVPPGQYVLRVMTPRIAGGTTPPSTPERPILWASETITVGETDLSNLTISLRSTFRVSGQIEFKGTSPVPTGEVLRESIRLALEPATGSWGGAATSVDAAGTFRTGVAGGTYFVTSVGPPGWYLDEVRFDGRDFFDLPIEIKGDVAGVQLVYSDQASQVAGTVRAGQGSGESSPLVIAFPSDRRQWVGYSRRFPRRVVSGTVDRSGAFALTALPPGDYLLAAIPESLENWRDPKVLESIARSATRVSLARHEKRTVDLTLTAVRQP